MICTLPDIGSWANFTHNAPATKCARFSLKPPGGPSIQFSSDSNCLGLSGDCIGSKVQSNKTGLPPDASCTSQGAAWTSDQLAINLGVSTVPSRFENSLELTELKKALSITSLPWRIQVSIGQIKGMHRRYGRGACITTTRPPPPSTSMCLPTWKLSEAHHLGVFMEVSLHRHD